MHIHWDDAQLFLALAEAGSVSGAAQKLGITQPTASRRLAALEAQIGEPLVTRSVSGIALTSFGERLLGPAQRMAEWAGELERAAAKRETEATGVVRVTAPPGFAFDFVTPFARSLAGTLPGVRLEVVSTVKYLDLARREADLAIRLARPTTRDLVTLATLELKAAPFAHEALARKLGPSPAPADVPWIAWAPPLDDTPPNSALARMIPGFAPAFASDDFLVQYRAAELGLGAIFLARMHHRFSQPTPLVELSVRGIPVVPSGLHLVCARTALDIPRIRAVADALAAELRHVRTDARSEKPSPKRRAK